MNHRHNAHAHKSTLQNTLPARSYHSACEGLVREAAHKTSYDSYHFQTIRFVPIIIHLRGYRRCGYLTAISDIPEFHPKRFVQFDYWLYFGDTCYMTQK